jgi:hypothetical protein
MLEVELRAPSSLPRDWLPRALTFPQLHPTNFPSHTCKQHSCDPTQPLAITSMARTRAAKSAKEPPQTPAVQTPIVQTASPPRRSTRKTRTTQPIHDIASDEDDSTVNPEIPKSTKATKKTPIHLQEATADQPPPGPRYNPDPRMSSLPSQARMSFPVTRKTSRNFQSGRATRTTCGMLSMAMSIHRRTSSAKLRWRLLTTFSRFWFWTMIRTVVSR